MCCSSYYTGYSVCVWDIRCGAQLFVCLCIPPQPSSPSSATEPQAHVTMRVMCVCAVVVFRRRKTLVVQNVRYKISVENDQNGDNHISFQTYGCTSGQNAGSTSLIVFLDSCRSTTVFFTYFLILFFSFFSYARARGFVCLCSASKGASRLLWLLE